jgi:hypothetical protein
VEGVMRAILSLMSLLLVVTFGSLSWGEDALPSAEQIFATYKTAKNENERYQQIGQLTKKTDAIAQVQAPKTYLQIFKEMIEFSQSAGDADWVTNRLKQLIQIVSETKFQLLTKTHQIVPLEVDLQNEYIFYLGLSSENFQHVYLSKQVTPFLIQLSEKNDFIKAYGFFEKIGESLNQVAEYIERDIENAKFAVAFLFCQNYRALQSEELELWLPRMSSEGMQKLFVTLDSHILSAVQGTTHDIAKATLVSKILFQILFEQFKNDPFNEWQYIKALKCIIAATNKYQQLGWVIPPADVQFLIEHLSPMAFVNFCNELGGYVVQKKVISLDLARQLLKTYELLNATIKKEKYLYDAVTFLNAFSILQKSLLPHSDIEGAYRLHSSKYEELIIAFSSNTTMVAGVRTDDQFVNLAFDYMQYEEDGKVFVGRTSVGPGQFVLQFKVIGNGRLEACINGECASATRYYKFPEFLSLLGKDKNLILPGIYKGKVTFADGIHDDVKLLVSAVGGYLVGNFDFGVHNHLGLDKGIHENTDGVLYLSGKVSTVPAIHIIRAVLNSKNQLSGVWFATTKAKIGKFTLVKQNP